jgi:hypothetical protein
MAAPGNNGATVAHDLKLFDCFIFSDELDLLELRLRLSSPFVDRFVLVEATKTFSGRDKPLLYASNSSRFAKWHDVIEHVVVDDMPPLSENRWAAEVHQRNALVRGLESAQPDDIVIVSDADEIIYPEVLATLRSGCSGLTALEMRRTFRFANWLLPPSRYARAVRAMPFAMLVDPHQQRNHVDPDLVIHEAGRHFTTLGDVAVLTEKFETYSHAEMDNARQKSWTYLQRAQRMGLDPFLRKLVSVVSPAELCSVQRAFLQMRPDLFDFRNMPNPVQRQLFRWYARWRARQPHSSLEVAQLDHNYDQQLARVAVAAGSELAREGFWGLPRRGAREVKRQLAGRR